MPKITQYADAIYKLGNFTPSVHTYRYTYTLVCRENFNISLHLCNTSLIGVIRVCSAGLIYIIIVLVGTFKVPVEENPAREPPAGPYETSA